jgi:hypothetical protein
MRIAAERSATVLFVTHNLEEALYLADRVIALYSDPGRIARILDIPLPRPRDHWPRASILSSCACGASCSPVGREPLVERWRGLVASISPRASQPSLMVWHSCQPSA